MQPSSVHRTQHVLLTCGPPIKCKKRVNKGAPHLEPNVVRRGKHSQPAAQRAQQPPVCGGGQRLRGKRGGGGGRGMSEILRSQCRCLPERSPRLPLALPCAPSPPYLEFGHAHVEAILHVRRISEHCRQQGATKQFGAGGLTARSGMTAPSALPPPPPLQPPSKAPHAPCAVTSTACASMSLPPMRTAMRRSARGRYPKPPARRATSAWYGVRRCKRRWREQSGSTAWGGVGWVGGGGVCVCGGGGGHPHTHVCGWVGVGVWVGGGWGWVGLGGGRGED